MKIRLRAFLGFAAVVVATAVLVPAGSSRVAVPPKIFPTVYFVYANDCTFTMQNDAGNVITSLAPGQYTVDVRTPEAFGAVPLTSIGATGFAYCKGLAQFQLTGPGINLQTSVFGGCLADEVYTETFQPSTTYIAQDNNQPATTRTSFNTLSAAFTVSPTTVTSGSTSGTSSTDIVGSGIAVKATLAAMLNPQGVPSLTLKGKSVSKLQAGRYTFSITDRDSKGSFVIIAPNKSAKNLTGVKFVGKRSATLKLTAGRWAYSTGARKTVFVVTAA
ncbi:MAG TPA: hypothetical protein VH063_06185 [Gaiellaceae bacterium]|nr:hypothetical protein [Gaiellaceae bacterium]